MYILETKDLVYCYEDGSPALSGVNIGIKSGITTAVIGGNGSGKSTLFLNFNGVLRPTAGEVFFNGRPVKYGKNDLLSLREQVGIVFQNSEEQLFSANVRKDIAFGLKNMGLPDSEITDRMNYIIEKTGIEDIVDKPTHALSFGQKKRVAIAGILAMQPSVIIMDEPTAGLDPQGVSEILKLINEFRESYGITVVYSTHELDLIPLYSDEVYVMDGGKIYFHGTPEELWHRAGLLREHNLRLPRIAHLMEILKNKDNLDVDIGAATISKARENIKHLIGEDNGSIHR